MTPQELVSRYEAALASQDWKQVEPLMHEDITVTFSDNSLHIGLAAVQAAFEKNFSTIKNEAYSMQNINWEEIGDEYCSFTFEYHWKGYINGQLYEGNGIGNSQLKCTDGRWQLINEVLSKA